MLSRITFIFVIFSFSSAWGQQSVLGFNWAKLRGLKMADELIQSQPNKSNLGARISPEFWSELSKSQLNSDNLAGDGLYFSTHLFDSQQFGPNLLIVELVLGSGDMNQFITARTAHESETQRPDQLSPVVRYAGSWHVIRRLPTKEEKKYFQIFVRPPTTEDADLIFKQLGLENDIVSVTEYLGFVVKRGVKDEHSTTQNFLNRFKERLVEKISLDGLSVEGLTLEQLSRITENLRRLFESMDQSNKTQGIFKIDLKILILRSLLNSYGTNADRILTSLFYNHSEILIKLSRGKILERVIKQMRWIKGLEVFLITRELILKYGGEFLSVGELEHVRNLDLPLARLGYVSAFYTEKMKSLPVDVIENYFLGLSNEAKEPWQKIQVRDYINGFAFKTNKKISFNSCLALF